MNAILDQLKKSLEKHFASREDLFGLVVAYSGGRDSTVLLHALSVLQQSRPISLRAVYVDHNIHSDSSQWGQHCIQFCQSLNLPCEIETLQLDRQAGQGLEDVARRARYQAFKKHIRQGESLVTAHHQDDQAETLLLQLLRGAGPKGLAAMPDCKPFGEAYHIRPLLNITREDIVDYAKEHQLSWIDDPSNDEIHIDRNYLRKEIMPRLQARWPASERTISRSANHIADMTYVLQEYLREDLARALVKPEIISLERLGHLSRPRQAQLIRVWLHEFAQVTPTTEQLNRILNEVIDAGEDREPVFELGEMQLRRYRQELYLLERPRIELDHAQIIHWKDWRQPLEVPGLGLLRIDVSNLDLKSFQNGEPPHRSRESTSMDPGAIESASKIEIRFRQGGETCKLPGRGSQSLKKLYQESGVPPWERERLPLLYIDGQLAAVARLWVCEPFQARENRPGVILRLL